jgi:uncharacterized protein (TIGR03083 family)
VSNLLGVDQLVAERHRFMATIVTLSDAEFEHGTTLCGEWTVRDVLAHLVGTTQVTRYVRGGLRVNAVNNAIVAEARGIGRSELTGRGHEWAANPSVSDRASARFLLGDVSVHHQDVLRGLGRTREIPVEAAAAIFREGVLLSVGTKRNLFRNRVEPTTIGGRALGRGRTIRGSTEVLGLWLAGRKGLDAELEFVD